GSRHRQKGVVVGRPARAPQRRPAAPSAESSATRPRSRRALSPCPTRHPRPSAWRACRWFAGTPATSGLVDANQSAAVLAPPHPWWSFCPDRGQPVADPEQPAARLPLALDLQQLLPAVVLAQDNLLLLHEFAAGHETRGLLHGLEALVVGGPLEEG